MREFGPASLGLSGSLLIAHPSLLDPNFRRTVVFIGAHDPEEGSFGLILNRPTGQTVGDFLEVEDVGGLVDVPVFDGGPVGRGELTFAAFRGEQGLIEGRTHLDPSEARAMAESGEAVRGFLGYAGWSKGQLEAELTQKSWLVQRPDQNILDLENCEQLWRNIMREQGPWFRLLASAPDDPSMN